MRKPKRLPDLIDVMRDMAKRADKWAEQIEEATPYIKQREDDIEAMGEAEGVWERERGAGYVLKWWRREAAALAQKLQKSIARLSPDAEPPCNAAIRGAD
jgi:hypothetical protein